MAKRTGKRKYPLKESPQRESDESGDEVSDEQSEISSIDSEAEASSVEEGDISPDK